MNRMWRGPDREPTEAAPVVVGPRSTVPHHQRLRDRLIELYGLDDGCSDDAIVLAALTTLQERGAAEAAGWPRPFTVMTEHGIEVVDPR